MDVAAPGEKIPVTGAFGLCGITHGTSIAVPHVTGVASLLWEKDLTKTHDFIRQLIELSQRLYRILLLTVCGTILFHFVLSTVTMAEVNKEEIVWENGVETEDGIIWGDLVYKIRYNNTERVMITGIKPGVSDVVIPELLYRK